MKCPHYLQLNASSDVYCYQCGARLPEAGSDPAAIAAATPQWAYLFAVFCGIIPIISLGGAIPMALGFGGAGGCLAVSRRTSVPGVLRFLVCVGITIGVWIVFAALMAAVMELSAPSRR